MKQGLILFGHGSRDPRWVEPFERLAARIHARAPGLPVRLAFLESIAPDLDAAAEQLLGEGVTSVHIVPIFLGQGGHVRSDLPLRVDRLRRRYPSIEIRCAAAIGEDDAVIEALAGFCLRGLA